MARLPSPGADEGKWGAILNTFLRIEHNEDGSLRKAALITNSQQKSEKSQPNGYAPLDHTSKLPSTHLPLASDTTTGGVRLNGDLGGTAVSPRLKNAIRVFNVQDFGALGDNSHDDTDAIRQTITEASATGGLVFIPEGTYLVRPTPGLQIPANTTIKGAGWKSIIKIPDNYQQSNNLIRFEGISNSHIADLCLEGNFNQQPITAGVPDFTQYGLYFGGSENCTARNIFARNFTGVGIHLYDSDSIALQHCYSTQNYYHGFEVEQCRHSSITQFRGWENKLHGLLVSPGEVGGSGSKGNTFSHFSLDHNDNYGLALNAANGDISAFLCEGNIFSNGSITNNAHYGLQVYKQDKQIFNNLYIADNGYFGIYLYQSAFSQFTNLHLHNNSRAGHGAYDEIFLEGAADGHASSNNIFESVHIIIDDATKAGWAIREATINETANSYRNVSIPYGGANGKTDIKSPQSIVDSAAGTQHVYGGQALSGASAGIDNAFNILRLYSNLPNSEVQLVSTTGGIKMWSNGTERFMVDANGTITANTDTFRIATPKTPDSSSAAGTQGEIVWDNNYLYICVSTNSWKRVALSTW